MTKVFQVVKMGDSEWRVLATRSTHDKAENVVKQYIASDLLGTVYVTIIETWTNATPKPEWDED